MSAICQQPKSVATFKPRHFSYWGGHNKRRENTNVSRYNLEGADPNIKWHRRSDCKPFYLAEANIWLWIKSYSFQLLFVHLQYSPFLQHGIFGYVFRAFHIHRVAQCAMHISYHMVYFIGGYFAEPAVRGDVYFIPMISTLFNQLPPWGDPPTNVCNLGRCINGKFVAVWIFNTGWVLTAWCWVATRAKFGHNFSLYVWRGWP